VSVRVTPVAVDGPALCTRRSKVAWPPLSTADSDTVLVTERSASAVPGPVSVDWLLAGSLSPPPSTTAVLSIVAGGGSATSAFTRIGGYDAPAARTSVRVQSSTSPIVPEQSHPSAETIVIDVNAGDGNVSLTVTVVPSVGIVPAFDTLIVNGVGAPPTKPPVCVFVSVRSGASTRVVTSLLSDVSGVPRLWARKLAPA
jgi:hypothetical protein